MNEELKQRAEAAKQSLKSLFGDCESTTVIRLLLAECERLSAQAEQPKPLENVLRLAIGQHKIGEVIEALAELGFFARYDASGRLREQADQPKPAPVANKLTRTAPEVIYLCVSDDTEHRDEPFPRDTGEVTWATDDPVNATVKYVRADIAATSPPTEQPKPEPVAWRCLEQGGNGRVTLSYHEEKPSPCYWRTDIEPLYTAPPPPTDDARDVARVPAEMKVLECPTWADSPLHAAIWTEGWNACRAAMLGEKK